MRRASQEVKYEAGERFWSYVLRVVETLGFDGMSDEESDEEEEDIKVSGALFPNDRDTMLTISTDGQQEVRDAFCSRRLGSLDLTKHITIKSIATKQIAC